MTYRPIIYLQGSPRLGKYQLGLGEERALRQNLFLADESDRLFALSQLEGATLGKKDDIIVINPLKFDPNYLAVFSRVDEHASEEDIEIISESLMEELFHRLKYFQIYDVNLEKPGTSLKVR